MWFHATCVDLPADERSGVWSCQDCRYLSQDAMQNNLNISKLMNIVIGLKSSVDNLVKQQEKLNSLLHEKEDENNKLQTSNNKLQSTVTELQTKLDAQTWQNFRKKSPPKTLLVGSSVIKYLDEKKMVNTDVKCDHNAKLPDITNVLKKIPEDSGYNRIVILAGRNDILDDEPKKVIDSYEKVITAAKEITNSVTISSIPPCGKSLGVQEKLLALNAGLQVLAGEKECTFVNHSEAFTLQNGELNNGYLDTDQVHPNLLGSNRIAKALELICKNRENYDVSTRNPHKTKEDQKKTSFEKPSSRHNRRQPTTQSQSHQTVNKRRSPPSSKRRCRNCFEHNHETKDCGFRGPVVCHQCSQKGHKQKFCHEFKYDFNNYDSYDYQ